MNTGALVEPLAAQILSSSDPGYAPTAPPPMAREAALGLLADAGYSKQGKDLSLTIGVPEADNTALAVASTAADQLRSAGIDVTVASVPPRELYGTSLVSGDIDAIVGWARAGNDAATALASRFSCPENDPVEGGNPTITPTTKETTDEQDTAPAPSNLSGICDRDMQAEITDALDGDPAISGVLAALEPRLWALSAVLPIVQDATMAISGPGVQGAALTGAIPAGIFADAEKWSKTPQ